MEQLPAAIKGLIVLGIVIAIPVLLIAFWWLTIPLAAAIIGGVVYWKRQKRAANTV
jgi:TM2 domain-containing membrane protein YozV